MVRADFPYIYRVSRKLASGKYKDYWRFRRDGIDTPLPAKPPETAFLVRYAELMQQADARKNAPDTTPDRHTFAWLAQAYFASAEFNQLGEKTQDDYRLTIETRLIPILGPERFDCITRQMIKAIRDKTTQTLHQKGKKTLSVRTAHKVKQVASLLYTWADGEDLLPANFTNPAMGIKKLKARSKPIEIWSTEEIALFLSKTEGVARTACLLAVHTGQRREDLVQMVWSDVQGDVIRVRQNKTGEPLTIPCHSRLKKELAAIRTQFGGPILRGANKKPMNANQLSAAMNRAVASVPGMPHRSLHGLRYAAAGQLEAVGCSVVQISAIIGHRTYQMAMKYASQRKDAEAAMDKVERA